MTHYRYQLKLEHHGLGAGVSVDYELAGSTNATCDEATIWQLRWLVDSYHRGCAFVRMRQRGSWNRIAIWKADMLVRAGLARWIN